MVCSGTTERMGVVQFLRECKVKTNSHTTMATGPSAGKPMASQLGVSRATKYIQLSCCIFSIWLPHV